MPIWKTRPIEQIPQLVLTQWTVRELPSGDRHFVGYNLTEMEGRVSSMIVEFDPNAMVGRTRSGRVYKLDGSIGGNADAEYTWNRWLSIYGLSPEDTRILKEDELTTWETDGTDASG